MPLRKNLTEAERAEYYTLGGFFSGEATGRQAVEAELCMFDPYYNESLGSSKMKGLQLAVNDRIKRENVSLQQKWADFFEEEIKEMEQA